jgi:hypothetical protein
MTKIVVVGTYFGSWPVWLPAFLVSCERNETIEWRFFTDCPLPDRRFGNIRFERLTLEQLNGIASARLGTRVRKGPYSQSDLRPTYGVMFADYLEGFDVWGHCDFDVIWGDLRRFLPESVLRDYDVVSFRREFLAGHLTLWRNEPDANHLFRAVPGCLEILRDEAYFNLDESIISTFLKSQMAEGACPLRVHWPDQMIRWFRAGDDPDGWSWRDGRVFDPGGREHVYLHLQEAKRRLTHIDFGVGDRPRSFVFTPSGIESTPRRDRTAEARPVGPRSLGEHAGRAGWRVVHAVRSARRALTVRDRAWATALTDAGVGAADARPDSTGAVVLTRLGVRLEKRHAGLLAAYGAALELVDRCDARFSNDGAGDVEVDVGGFRASIGSAADVLTLRDLLVGGVYNWRFSRPTAVLDVCMGSGLAALHLGSRPDVVAIGYEPCRGPYERALRNLALNEGLTGRVRMVNAGIGSLAFRTIAMFPPHDAGGHGRDRGRGGHATGPTFAFEEIDIVDVAAAVREVRAQFPDRHLVITLSYERAEYAVDGLTERGLLARLRETGDLSTVDGVMGRWGDERVAARAETSARELCGDGFEVLVMRPRDGQQWLHAVRAAIAERPGVGSAPEVVEAAGAPPQR